MKIIDFEAAKRKKEVKQLSALEQAKADLQSTLDYINIQIFMGHQAMQMLQFQYDYTYDILHGCPRQLELDFGKLH